MTPLVRPQAPPAVSVIIPAYNAGRTIDAALHSVFIQTYRDFEVIVVDDDSTDDTAARLQAWGDRIIVTRQPNAGPAAARNLGIRMARGKWLAFLDADDVWLPNKLERQVAYFEKYPATGLVHTETYYSHSPLMLLFEATESSDAKTQPPTNEFCSIFHCRLTVKTLTVMAPRQVVIDAGLFDERRELHVEDWDLWLRIAARHPIGYLPTRLAIHRPGGGMSSNVEKTFHGQTLVIDKVLPICAAACPHHRQDPQACLGERRHLLHSQLGYERFWRGQRIPAREAYRQALRTNPRDWRARVYLVACSAGGWSLGLIRAVRNELRGLRPSSRSGGRDLLQDTAYRRFRTRIADLLHAADGWVSKRRTGPQRVLFEAASPLSMAVFQPIYRHLKDDARLQFWFTATDESWDAHRIFHNAGITERILSRDEVRWKKFDAYINTDFWNMTWLSRRTKRLHLFHGVAGKYGLDAPVDIAPLIATFDRLMFVNKDRLTRYVDAGLVDGESPRAALIGYPKVDCLVDGSLDRDRIAASLGIDRQKPTVLYAPTWSPHSSLNTLGEKLIRELASLEVNVLIKLHDRSLDATERGSGGIDWRERLTQLCRDLRVHLAEAADASPYLYVADVLVTDHSSVGFEFMLLDRPIVVVNSPELLKHGRVNPQKAALLQSAAHVINSPDSLAETVKEALADPMRFSGERRAISGELFYRPGSATARAVNCIYQVLALPMLAPASATTPQPAAGAAVPLTSLEMGARQT
jgi:glycosyltransferase involved in cell wall biosynthesis